MPLLEIAWGKLDWAQIIATVGAVVVAILTLVTQRTANKSMDSAKDLVKTIQDSIAKFDSHFKASDSHVRTLIDLLGNQLKKQDQP